MGLRYRNKAEACGMQGIGKKIKLAAGQESEFRWE